MILFTLLRAFIFLGMLWLAFHLLNGLFGIIAMAFLGAFDVILFAIAIILILSFIF